MKSASPHVPPRTLEALRFEPRFAALGEDYYARVAPTPVAQPHLVSFNADAAALIGLDADSARAPMFIEVMAGNRKLPDGDYLSMLYAGHQFGVYVPQLGDGRAILIGQVRNAQGELWDLQLKGAGKTPFSRFGDGRAVLRSTIREYLGGEALHGLGIPTTRALCIVGSPEPVQRETVETAALLCRMARSHVRFGHFEVFYYRQQFEKLRPLADHVIDEYYPELRERPDRYAAWLAAVAERTAQLIAQWQAVGFCHGVMNTDNMSITGQTLDYGPFAFLDAFDAHYICNHTDEGGRYAYDQQPGVAHWNLSRLFQATLPLLAEDPQAAVEIATPILERYPKTYVAANLVNWSAKLGFREALPNDPDLINRFLTLLDRSRADFTRSFRLLAGVRTDTEAPATGVREYIRDVAAFDAWVVDYRARLRQEQSDDAARAVRMNRINPKYVLRNYMAQVAIEQAQQGNFSEIEILRQLLRRPYDEQPAMERYFAEPPPWAQSLALSCSS